MDEPGVDGSEEGSLTGVRGGLLSDGVVGCCPAWSSTAEVLLVDSVPSSCLLGGLDGSSLEAPELFDELNRIPVGPSYSGPSSSVLDDLCFIPNNRFLQPFFFGGGVDPDGI